MLDWYQKGPPFIGTNADNESDTIPTFRILSVGIYSAHHDVDDTDEDEDDEALTHLQPAPTMQP